MSQQTGKQAENGKNAGPDKQALRITQGVKTTVRGISNGTYRLKTITGDFLGIGSAESELVKAEKILKQFQADAEMI